MKVEVELYSENTGKSMTIMLPTDNVGTLKTLAEFTEVIGMEPQVDMFLDIDDLLELNKVIDAIEQCPVDFDEIDLDTMYYAARNSNMSMEELLEKLRENDFQLYDISGYSHKELKYKYDMSLCEIAACYLATIKQIPFLRSLIGKMDAVEKLLPYLCWEEIWDLYEQMGFRKFQDGVNKRIAYIRK